MALVITVISIILKRNSGIKPVTYSNPPIKGAGMDMNGVIMEEAAGECWSSWPTL